MKPIRILQVVTIMNRGGLETMLMNYYREMDRSKIQFDFMVHRMEEGHYDEEIKKLGGNIFRMPPIRPGHYRKYFKRLNEFFVNHNEYKVVHSHINENSSFVLRAAKTVGVPCRIAHSHLSDLGFDFKLPFRLYARYSMKNYPNSYFACSVKAGQWLFNNRSTSTKEVIVLNNAVNTKEFRYNENMRNDIRNELGIDKSQLVIGHVGRFNKQKNHEYLIDIFHAVYKQRPNSILTLVGDGDLRQGIERKVKSLGLSANVKFLGVRNDISNLMQAMDLFLFPSLFEGLPVVLVEAQAAGLQCIVSDAITVESNITGNVEYISLGEPTETWAGKILSASYEHKDTSRILNEQGYDTKSMSKWLMEYYREHAL
ncbi:glycosyltransferase family 1 protein [Priestia aryabhattai]|uniref:glycosyltransferase family 1 protein n=1 Tax=Priestia TaxID=2800373 RepID=UPI002E24ED84|nr:glycosyltransferase family 1 protein [Priestia aryabhattai]MED3992450.1 glycosyltransferase family 1 protein [Priestia aryabhattai]MED4008609.1 glycosyltransferase family 1 protein [Priestia aryabhattai]